MTRSPEFLRRIHPYIFAYMRHTRLCPILILNPLRKGDCSAKVWQGLVGGAIEPVFIDTISVTHMDDMFVPDTHISLQSS